MSGRPAAPALRDVQQLFWELIAAPEGVAKGIAALEAEGEPAGALVDAWIHGDERLDARGRLDVYANMYFFRIRDVVAEDFPAIVKLIGAARWHNLMTDYLLAHPSHHWSLRWVGVAMPAFLATHALAAERPDIADLARLEWALSDVFQQVDVPELPRAALAAVPPERWPDIRFEAAPTARLLDVGHEVGSLRDALMALPEGEEQTLAVAAARGHALLVWREDEISHHEEVASPAALRALLEGEPFGEVCERMAVERGEERASEESAAEAAGLLAMALERGLLSGFRLDEPPAPQEP